MTDDEAAFMRTILDHPDADLPRLVFVDWLEENGQAERAEFIRLQIETTETKDMRLWELMFNSKGWFPDICKATGNLEDDWGVCHDGSVHYDGKYRRAEFWVRRGFPAELRGPLDWLRGGECEVCRLWSVDTHIPRQQQHSHCRGCKGTGRTPGHLRELVRRWPIQRVVVTDRGPDEEPQGDGTARWLWWREVPHNPLPIRRGELPVALYDRVAKPLSGILHTYTVFATREAAVAALSDALFAEAKEGKS